MSEFSLASASNLFKIKYGKLSENTYNSANVLLGRIKKQYDFTGKQLFVPVPVSFGGGVGSGTLPTANKADYQDALITAKRVYSVVQVEREAIKASMNSEGAFVQATKEVVQKGVESHMRNASRILFGDGTGTVGTITGNATGTAADPVITVTAATFKEADIEERDYINCGTDSSVFEIVSLVVSTRVVTLARISGSLDLTSAGAGLVMYMQNSKDNDPQGLKGVLDATSGTLYGITVGRRWQAQQEAAGAAAITTDILNKVVLDVQRASGKVPNLCLMSFTQYRKYLALLESQKRYMVEPRAKELKGKISFTGIEMMTSAGPIPVFPERFMEEDRVYMLNDNYITCHHRPDFGWFDDDGSVFLREASSDSYSARYGGYYENYIVPPFHAVISGLAL